MKRANLYRLILLGGVGLALTACGGGGGSATTTPITTQSKIEDSFGTQFGVDYRASPNSVPVKPAPGDIIPLQPAQTPIPLH